MEIGIESLVTVSRLEIEDDGFALQFLFSRCFHDRGQSSSSFVLFLENSLSIEFLRCRFDAPGFYCAGHVSYRSTLCTARQA